MYFTGRARPLGLWLTLSFVLGGPLLRAASPASSKAAKPKPPAAIPVAQVPSVVEGLQALGSGPARLVWVLGRDVEDLFVQGKTGQLYVLDTEDGKGQRCLLEEVTSYAKPMLSPDGRQIVFTNLDQKAVFAVNFDGTGLRKLVEGYASDVWWDPGTSHTWCMCARGIGTRGGASFAAGWTIQRWSKRSGSCADRAALYFLFPAQPGRQCGGGYLPLAAGGAGQHRGRRLLRLGQGLLAGHRPG